MPGSVSTVEYKVKKDQERKERFMAKPLHGRFLKAAKEDEQGNAIAGPRSWEWVKSGYMTKNTEAYIFAAQEQALTTNSVRSRIHREVDDDGAAVSGMCRVCGEKMETVAHIAGGCRVLMEGPGTVRHDKVGARVHWELCRKYGVECSARWYEHKPQTISVNESGDVTIYWAMKWTVPNYVYHKVPDVVVVDRKAKLWTIIDFAVPLDFNIVTKQQEKIETYQKLAAEFCKMHRGIQTKRIPIVVGAFGSIPKDLPRYLQELGIPDIVGGLQKTALLGTQRILKNVLSR